MGGGLKWWALVLALALAAGPRAFGEIRLTVLAGAGGHIRAGAIISVIVDVENDAEDRTGVFYVTFRDLASASVHGWARRTVPLPPHTRKRLFFYLPAPETADEVVVRLHKPDGKEVLLHAEPLNLLDADTPVLCTVGIMPPTLPEARLDNKQLYTQLYLTPDQLPRRHDGLDMFDVVLIAPPLARPIDAVQGEALRDWVLRGGTLVLDVSERCDALRNGALADLAPFVPKGIDQVELTLFDEELIIATGEHRAGIAVLESDGYPLVLRRNLGLGSVVAFTFPMDASVLKDWPGRPALWDDLLGALRLPEMRARDPVRFRPFTSFQMVRSGALRALVSAKPSGGIRMGLVIVLVLFYALIVGPADYILVKSLRKPKLTWFTFPTIVALFTILAYVGAKHAVGGQESVQNVQRIVVFPEIQLALRYDLSCFFASQGGDHVIRDCDQRPLRHVAAIRAAEPRLVIDQDGHTIEQRVPTWAERLYATSDTTPYYPDVDFALETQDGQSTIVVKNNLNVSLRNLYAWAGEGWIQLRESVPPNAVRRIAITPELLRVPPVLKRAGSQPDLFATLVPEEGAFPGRREFDLRDALRRRAVVLYAQDAGTAPCPLVVDGKHWNIAGKRSIMVLRYGESAI